jgi:hypothetical protein
MSSTPSSSSSSSSSSSLDGYGFPCAASAAQRKRMSLRAFAARGPWIHARKCHDTDCDDDGFSACDRLAERWYLPGGVDLDP